MIQPFTWNGNTGQQLTPGQAKVLRELAMAKANKPTPQNLGQGLASIGDALVYVTNTLKADEAESQGRSRVIEALSDQKWGGVLADPWADPAQQGYAASMMERGWQLEDRSANWAREDARAAATAAQPDYDFFESGGDRYRYDANDPNSRPELFFDGPDAPPAPPTIEEAYDPETGRPIKQQWVDGQWDDFGGVAAPKDPLVTVNTGDAPDAALSKALSTKEGESWAAIKDAAIVAGSNAQDFAVLDELIKVAPQGPIGGRLAETFQGFSSAGDAFKSIVKRIAPTLRVPGSGSTSDIEYAGMLQSLAGLPNTPEANRMIMSIMKAKQDVNIRRGEIVTAYQNGEISVGDARRQMAELNRISIVTPEMKEALMGVGARGTVGTTSTGLSWSVEP